MKKLAMLAVMLLISANVQAHPAGVPIVPTPAGPTSGPIPAPWFLGIQAFVLAAPVIIQQTNPICKALNCYDERGNKFVTDENGTHPVGPQVTFLAYHRPITEFPTDRNGVHGGGVGEYISE